MTIACVIVKSNEMPCLCAGKFDGLWVRWIVDVNVEVAGDDEIVRDCSRQISPYSRY